MRGLGPRPRRLGYPGYLRQEPAELGLGPRGHGPVLLRRCVSVRLGMWGETTSLSGFRNSLLTLPAPGTKWEAPGSPPAILSRTSVQNLLQTSGRGGIGSQNPGPASGAGPGGNLCGRETGASQLVSMSVYGKESRATSALVIANLGNSCKFFRPVPFCPLRQHSLSKRISRACCSHAAEPGPAWLMLRNADVGVLRAICDISAPRAWPGLGQGSVDGLQSSSRQLASPLEVLFLEIFTSPV